MLVEFFCRKNIALRRPASLCKTVTASGVAF